MRNKALAVLLTLTLFLAFLPVMPVAAETGTGFGGLWHFDEGNGTTANDASGNNNSGTILGGALWTTGKHAKALDFDGVDDYVDVPDSDSLDITGNITLEAWIYPRSLTDRQAIVCKYNHTTLRSSYYLSLGGTLGTTTYLNKIYFALCLDGNQYYAMVSNTNITTNTWTHVAATMNSTYMILYINGVRDKVRVFPPGAIYAGNASLRIGCYLPEAGYPRFFNGTIDEVRVASGTIWTVDDDKVQCPNADFVTIQAAIDVASPSDTIFVHDGTYREALVINKSLTIKAASKPIIEAPDTRTSYTIAESSATFDPIIFAYGGAESGGAVSGAETISVTIEGFEITGRNTAAAAPKRFVGVLYRNVKLGAVADCNIHSMYDADGEGNGPQTFGVLVYGDSDATISYNEVLDFSRGGIGVLGDNGPIQDPTAIVEHNKVVGNGLENGSGWWAENGIQIGYGSHAYVNDNNVTQCKVNSPSWVSTGILVILAAQDINVLQNNVEDCDTGIAMSVVGSPSSDVVDSNTVARCTWDGIRLGLDGPLDNALVTNNIISNCMMGIGVWDSSDNTIEHNIVTENQYGVIIDGDSNNNIVVRNDVLDNTVDGVLVEPYGGFDPSGTKIHYNNITNNTAYGVEETGAILTDARFNWWGSATGPTHVSNSGGTGDIISDNVDYSPWLGFTAGTVPMTYHINPTGTIQEAIDETSSGDTIVVHEGIYDEALYVSGKSLTIMAASNPIVRGGQSRATNYGNRQATVFVEDANNVVLQGLDVEGQGLSGKSYAVLYENSGGTVQNCTLSPNTLGDMASVAVAAWDNSDLTVKDCLIQNFGRIGVYSNNATMNIEGNTIIGQTYSQDNLVNYGIEIEDYSGPSVANITQNVIYNCNNTNPNPLWSSAAIIVDTWREWADYYNLNLQPSKVSITYNEIYDNYEAIEIVASEFSFAHYNNFFNNVWGVWSAPENWTTNPTYHVFDACNNWWGDPTGPFHNSSWLYEGQPYGPHYGLGDIASDYVLYYPWLNGPSGAPVEPPTASFTVSPAEPKVGGDATFNASASAANGGTIVTYQWNFGDGNLTSTGDPTLTHAYGAEGVYNVTLTVFDSEGLSGSTSQNITVVPALTHDVAVTNVTASTDHAYQGWTVDISVTVENIGEANETFTLTLYYDGNVLATETVTDLQPNMTSTLNINWNTIGVPYCHNYTIKAVATAVPGETNTTNNELIDGTVKIRILGDVNGDGTVELTDMYLLSLAFGSCPDHSRWNPDADINHDDYVELIDFFLVGQNFGLTC